MRVSVVVPVYNAVDTIGACIRSIVEQEFEDFEVVVVDDGSNDGSGAVCDEWMGKETGTGIINPRQQTKGDTDCCQRIRVVHQPNRGRTAARAVGVRESSGEWIAFVDSDDRLPRNALSLLYSRATDDVDIVLGNGHLLGDGEWRATIPMPEFRHLAVRAEGPIGVPWGSLYRRRVVTPYLFDIDRRIVNGEDYLFWLRLVFTTDRSVNVVYESVYDKGDAHTSNSFVWTADYCYELNELRKAAIPEAERPAYLSDMVADRLENMFSVAQWTPRSQWRRSQFYKELLSDMALLGMKMPLKSRLFLSLPSVWLRKVYGFLSS